MSDKFTTILFDKTGGIGWIALNRPHVFNAYNMAMRDELFQALTAIRDDPEIQGAILYGNCEQAFCAGADLNEFGTAPSVTTARQVRWERDVWGLFLTIQKPLIAALHGYVLGSGLEMALLCDLRIVSQDCIFGLPEASLGMIPAAGGTQTLPRITDQASALYLLLTGQQIKAKEAYNLGLATQVVSKDTLLLESKKILDRILLANPLTIQAAKSAIVEGMNMSLHEGLELEKRIAIKSLVSNLKHPYGLDYKQMPN